MKKIYLLLMLLPLKVNAHVIFSDYSLVLENSPNYLKESDTLKREEKHLYQNYRLKKENLGYFSLSEKITGKVDYDDFLEKEIYLTKYEEGATGPYTNYVNNYNKKFRYLKINNFETKDVILNKIQIFDNDERIYFTIHQTNFLFRDTVNEESEIILDFINSYNLDNIKIIFFINATHSENITFNFSFTDNIDNEFVLFHANSLRNEDQEKYTVFFNEEKESISYFLKHEKLYNHFILKREYVDLYTEKALENHFLDKDKCKIKYDYYKRDKILINTNINDLNDPIVVYTSSNIKSIDNFDILKNGIQTINVCLESGYCFLKDINVDIKRREFRNTNLTSIKKSEKIIINEPKENIIIKSNEKLKSEKKNYKNIFISLSMLLFLLIILKFKRSYVESV